MAQTGCFRWLVLLTCLVNVSSPGLASLGLRSLSFFGFQVHLSEYRQLIQLAQHGQSESLECNSSGLQDLLQRQQLGRLDSWSLDLWTHAPFWASNRDHVSFGHFFGQLHSSAILEILLLLSYSARDHSKWEIRRQSRHFDWLINSLFNCFRGCHWMCCDRLPDDYWSLFQQTASVCCQCSISRKRFPKFYSIRLMVSFQMLPKFLCLGLVSVLISFLLPAHQFSWLGTFVYTICALTTSCLVAIFLKKPSNDANQTIK